MFTRSAVNKLTVNDNLRKFDSRSQRTSSYTIVANTL